MIITLSVFLKKAKTRKIYVLLFLGILTEALQDFFTRARLEDTMHSTTTACRKVLQDRASGRIAK